MPSIVPGHGPRGLVLPAAGSFPLETSLILPHPPPLFWSSGRVSGCHPAGTVFFVNSALSVVSVSGEASGSRGVPGPGFAHGGCFLLLPAGLSLHSVCCEGPCQLCGIRFCPADWDLRCLFLKKQPKQLVGGNICRPHEHNHTWLHVCLWCADVLPDRV